MSVINTGAFSKALQPGVNTWYGIAYNDLEQQYKAIFKTETSDKYFEEDVGAYGTGLAVVKPEGEDITYDSMGQGFRQTYTHKTYALGFVISREAIEDNKYMELAKVRSEFLGKSMRQTKEIVAANVLNRAFNSSYAGADGLELCSTAHLLAKGGTFRNELATAADLSEASIEQAMIDIMDMKDDANLRIAVMPRKLVIPTALRFEADRILKSTLQNDTANNAINALKHQGVLPEGVVMNNYLTDSNAWFILTDCPNGLRHFQRRGMELENDTDFASDNVKFKASERYSFGFTDPRGVFGSPGAA